MPLLSNSYGVIMKIWTVLLVAALALTGINAEAAKRLGGGKSMGQQSSNVTQRDAAPGAPAQSATNAAPKPAGAAAPAASPKRPWGAMLGGLAAGLGLAWLAELWALGEGMGQVLMFALLAMVVVMGIGWFMPAGGTNRGTTRRSRFKEPALDHRCRIQNPIALKMWATTHRRARGSEAAWH
jgi:predicted lipid-binding transport protein (Tim44 family)